MVSTNKQTRRAVGFPSNRIAFAPNDEATASKDRAAMEQFINGGMSFPELCETVRVNNRLAEVTAEQMLNELVLCGAAAFESTQPKRDLPKWHYAKKEGNPQNPGWYAVINKEDYTECGFYKDSFVYHGADEPPVFSMETWWHPLATPPKEAIE